MPPLQRPGVPVPPPPPGRAGPPPPRLPASAPVRGGYREAPGAGWGIPVDVRGVGRGGRGAARAWRPERWRGTELPRTRSGRSSGRAGSGAPMFRRMFAWSGALQSSLFAPPWTMPE